MQRADTPLHLCHCSTADSVRMIKDAKEAAVGLKVTGEVSASFYSTDEDIPENNGIWKMNPPLRSKSRCGSAQTGIKRRVMDVITDHAPHMMSEKDKPMEQAAFGIVGLRQCMPDLYRAGGKGVLTVMQMAEKMSYNPARSWTERQRKCFSR